MHNYEYLEIRFYNIYLKNALTSMCAFLHRSVVIPGHSVDGLFNGYLVEMPAILDSLFYKVVDTTSTPIGVESGGWETIKWRDLLIQKIIWPNGINLGCFYLHISQNVATSMTILISQSCGDSLPAICLAGQVGTKYRPPEHSWMSDRPINKASVKVDL